MIAVDILVYKDTRCKVLFVELCGNYVDHRAIQTALRESMGESKFKKFLGDQKAKSKLGIRETVGGPEFSSVQVHLGAEITCNQDEDTIALAQNEMYDVCIPVLDNLIRDAYENLINHIEQLHKEEDE